MGYWEVHKAYLKKVLKKFSMHACNPTPTPIVKGD
jgi:hypothetical protein